MRNVRSTLVMAVLGMLVPAAAFAGSTSGTATPVPIGTRTSFALAPSDWITIAEWFMFQPTVGRSYCVEVTKSETELGAGDSELELYRANATTLIGYNNNSDSETNLFWGSRFCFVAMLAERHFVRVTDGWATKWDIRIVDTTLFSPYFAVGGGYDAAPQIRNNTSASVDVYFTAYNAAGTPLPGCPSTPITIPANGMTTFGVGSRCATTSAFGSAQIAHTGSPGAISANITTFSGGSGLSFDAAFTTRQDHLH